MAWRAPRVCLVDGRINYEYAHTHAYAHFILYCRIFIVKDLKEIRKEGIKI